MGLSQQALAELVGVNVNSVRAWEQGRATPYLRHHEPLRAALVVSQAELVRLLDPASPVELNGHKVPRWLNTYESLVLEAGRLCEVEFIAIPGLLQTKAYAAAAEQTTEMPLSDEQILERVDLRVARQAALYRDRGPLQVVTLLSEGVLRDPVGGPETMVEQLDHLMAMSERPNVELRLLGPGLAPAAIGGFDLLTRQGDVDPFMAVTFSVAGPHYVEVEDQVAKFVARFEHLVSTSVPPDETARRIHDIRESYR
jgi:transcriptional regulator with XRE-family HTH domain